MADLCPKLQQASVDNERLRVCRYDRFVFFRIARAGEHFQHALAQRNLSVDQYGFLFWIEPDWIIGRKSLRSLLAREARAEPSGSPRLAPIPSRQSSRASSLDLVRNQPQLTDLR